MLTDKAYPSVDYHKGITSINRDGFAYEAITVITQSAILTPMAIFLGATNFEIGLLFALPHFACLFQLFSVQLIKRFQSRKMITVFCSILSRFNLLVIGILLLFFHSGIYSIISVFLCLYTFASISTPVWSSWVKDIIPQGEMGKYFSKRTRNTKIFNIFLSIGVAAVMDYIRRKHPTYELSMYGYMYILIAVMGIISVLLFLNRAPEIRMEKQQKNSWHLYILSLKDGNFRRFLVFNFAWIFAVNIAVPFFTIFLMRGLGLSLMLIIVLVSTEKLFNAASVQLWGACADRFSNKTVIAISGPVYISTFIAWIFVGIYFRHYFNVTLLFIIYIATGVSGAGINLALNNISLKLSPKENTVSYLSVKSIIMGIAATIAPLIAGRLVDLFTYRHFTIDASWRGPTMERTIHLVALHDWTWLFFFSSILTFFALQLLIPVKEVGEIKKETALNDVRSTLKSNFSEMYIFKALKLRFPIWSRHRLKKAYDEGEEP